MTRYFHEAGNILTRTGINVVEQIAKMVSILLKNVLLSKVIYD